MEDFEKGGSRLKMIKGLYYRDLYKFNAIRKVKLLYVFLRSGEIGA